MSHPLDNPVFSALQSHNSNFCLGNERIKYFPKEVSPFLSAHYFDEEVFEEIAEMIGPNRTILLAQREPMQIPKSWNLKFEIVGTQFVFSHKELQSFDGSLIRKLDTSHVAEMIALTRLTKPGPFDERTIEFGNYEGIFSNGKLVSMAGWRMHIDNYLEVSAVCTHPDFLGRGYARTLLQSQINSILVQNKIPFLHSRADNERAINLYEGLGFVKNGSMNFYLIKGS